MNKRKRKNLELLRQECKNKLKELSDDYIENEIIKKARFYDDGDIFFILHSRIDINNTPEDNLLYSIRQITFDPEYPLDLDPNRIVIRGFQLLDDFYEIFYYQKDNLILFYVKKDTVLDALLPWNYKKIKNGFTILNEEELKELEKKLRKEKYNENINNNL